MKTAILLAGMMLISLPVHGQDTVLASLHAAALQGNLEVVRQHIEAGSDLDERDAYGSSPLIVAITFDQTAVAKALIEAGADVAVANNEGSTPLHLAALFGREEIAEILLDAGADRYVRNTDGATAFDIAAAPFGDDRPLYDQLSAGLAPLGLRLDYERIAQARLRIAEMLQPSAEELEAVQYAPGPDGDWSVSSPTAEGLDPMLVAELYLDAGHLDTIYGLLVIKNGRLVTEGYFNDGAPDRKARLQSVTKSFTSALVGLALAEGCLSSVDQTMLSFFPELADQIRDPRKQQITIRHLLQMRAGYPWEEYTPDLFEMLYRGFQPSLLVEVPLAYDPGSRFDYSNLSSHLLGIIVARACGTDLRSFAQDHLFEPLDIEAGEWIQDWEGYYNGHADLHLTARDAAKLGQMYLDGGVYEGQPIVPAEWVEASWQRYSEDVTSAGVQNGHVGRYFRDVGYGYQWWSARVGGHDFDFAWGHGGQLVVVLDALDLVVVVISDPLVGQHNDQAWGRERANLNLVGKYIRALPTD